MFAFNANKCVICYLLSNLKSKKITVENILRVCHNGPSGSSPEGFFAKAKRSETDDGFGH